MLRSIIKEQNNRIFQYSFCLVFIQLNFMIACHEKHFERQLNCRVFFLMYYSFFYSSTSNEIKSSSKTNHDSMSSREPSTMTFITQSQLSPHSNETEINRGVLKANKVVNNWASLLRRRGHDERINN